jgi:CcmD family protein
MTSLVAAYSVVFTAIFIFTWLMYARQKRLEKKLDELRELLKETKKSRELR